MTIMPLYRALRLGLELHAGILVQLDYLWKQLRLWGPVESLGHGTSCRGNRVAQLRKRVEEHQMFVTDLN